jgi:hypothetical protein
MTQFSLGATISMFELALVSGSEGFKHSDIDRAQLTKEMNDGLPGDKALLKPLGTP